MRKIILHKYKIIAGERLVDCHILYSISPHIALRASRGYRPQIRGPEGISQRWAEQRWACIMTLKALRVGEGDIKREKKQLLMF
jgi:hypothetical protein